MGAEGAGSADTAVRNAIDQGLFPGPRLRISGNAIDILGGHEDAVRDQTATRSVPGRETARPQTRRAMKSIFTKPGKPAREPWVG